MAGTAFRSILESMNDAKTLYLDLLRRSLLNLVYSRHEPGFDPETRENGLDHPAWAHTMIGSKRMENLQWCVEMAISEGIPGDMIETGVWRGGACILMRGVLAAHGILDRVVWVADSFRGLPKPDAARYPKDAGDSHHQHTHLAIPRREVESNFASYGLLDGQVRFLEGWFRDTMPSAPISSLAVLRLDGDMYQSTIEVLAAMYPKLSKGGFCIVDDYSLGGCHAAVHDYRDAHLISEQITLIDRHGAFWRKA